MQRFGIGKVRGSMRAESGTLLSGNKQTPNSFIVSERARDINYLKPAPAARVPTKEK